MAITTAAELLDALRRHSLPGAERLAELEATSWPDARALARALLQREWLTPFQANQILQGRGATLVLGPYLLLERLGEGGMGQVFKARHQLLDRIVAVKILRRERLDSAAAVERFRREMRLAAQLDHPNLVRCLDAAQVGDVHLLVMEYIAGTDLYQLVHKTGPLPVGRACEYTRQAALGLQHAADRGLVHRDIKPSNLQLSAQRNVVKILDLGLARACAGDEPARAELTQACAVVGTPDYIAPEQIADARQVDIRADLYSLGCTLYFFLAGRPPFVEERWEDKLVSHRKAEPPPIEQLRTDVPAPLAAVLRGLMAKRREDRPATPAAVADALAPFCRLNEPVAMAAVTGIRAGSDTSLLTPGGYERGWTLVPEPSVAQAPAARATATEVAAVAGPPPTAPPSHERGWTLPLDLSLDPVAPVVLANPPPLPAAVPATLPPSKALAPQSSKLPWLLVAVAGAGGALVLFLVLAVTLVAVLWPRGAAREPVVAPPHAAEPIANREPDRPPPPTRQPGPNALPPALGDVLAAGASVRLGSHGKGLCRAITFAPDGLHALSNNSGRLYIWDLKARSVVKQFKGQEFSAGPVAFAADGKRFAAGLDGAVFLGDGTAYEEIATLPARGLGEVSALAFAPDGTVLAVGDAVLQPGGKQGRVLVLDAAHPTKAAAAELHFRQRTFALAFAPDGQSLAAAGAPTLFGEPVNEGDKVIHLRRWQDHRDIKDFAGHEGTVTHLGFRADGKRLYSASLFDGTLRVWNSDAATADFGKAVKEIFAGLPTANVMFKKEATRVGAFAFDRVGGALVGYQDGSLRRYDLETGDEQRLPGRLGSGPEAVTALAVSPDGHYALAALTDHALYLVRLPAPRRLGQVAPQ